MIAGQTAETVTVEGAESGHGPLFTCSWNCVLPFADGVNVTIGVLREMAPCAATRSPAGCQLYVSDEPALPTDLEPSMVTAANAPAVDRYLPMRTMTPTPQGHDGHRAEGRAYELNSTWSTLEAIVATAETVHMVRRLTVAVEVLQPSSMVSLICSNKVRSTISCIAYDTITSRHLSTAGHPHRLSQNYYSFELSERLLRILLSGQ